MTVRTRFAPSPTGSLHIGGVRTAFYCWLFAKKSGGTFVLRIEDTDQARSTEEAAAGIQRDLRWCGLTWDEGPEVGGPEASYFQSQRLPIYNGYVEQLLASGHAYPAYETREELEALRKEGEANKTGFRYKFRPYSAEDLAKFASEGRIPVIRLKAPAHDITVKDLILGEVTVLAAELEDIVIRKADGFPTYHFAVVIDDHLMGITHILRGQEHLMNTHKHVGVYEALGWETPQHGHLPLIFNPTGSKMSKRDKAKEAREGAKKAQEERKKGGHHPEDWSWLALASGLEVGDVASFMRKEHDRIPTAEGIARVLGLSLPMIEVLDFLKGGYLPEALVNYMALLGWSPGDDRELMSFDEMVNAFTIDRVNRTAAKFDGAKLKWLNGEYIKKASAPRLLAALGQYLAVVDVPMKAATEAQLLALIDMYRDRSQTLADMEVSSRFLFVRPTTWDEKAATKVLKGDGFEKLVGCMAALVAHHGPWTAAALESSLTPIAGGNLGSIAQPLRIALSGTPVSPPIFETLAFLDRKEAITRIQNCIHHFEGGV